MSKGLDQFYTKDSIANECYHKILEIINKENLQFEQWLEPSAGKGAFYNLLPNNKIGIDLDPKIDDIIHHDFLTYPLNNKNYITIGNPPFGKNSSLAIKFFNKCAQHSLLIGFILPKTFKKHSILNKIDIHFHLIYEYDLPHNSFEYEGQDYDVPCVFQVWKKQDIKREKIIYPTSHNDFTFCNREEANFAVQRVGVNAGAVKKDLSIIAAQSHYFISSSEEAQQIFKEIDWASVKYNTAGNPSISKVELIQLYEEYKNKVI